jgi:glycosyltransferase involved in cell wall biosynthesis
MDLKILLIDDGSIDRSGQICDEMARKDSRIRVIHTPGRGVACARNTGLNEAKGEWISFVDGDGLMYPAVPAHEKTDYAVKIGKTAGFSGRRITRVKIAMMLAVHNHPEQANVFISQCLTDPDCQVFIHIDQKGLSIKDALLKDPRVHILPRSYSVEWGEFSQVQYVLYMMDYIREMGHFDYYSIHSGSDLLVRPMAELKAYLEKTDMYAYLDCHRLPWSMWQYGGGLGRLRLIWPKWMRKRLRPHSLQRYLRAVYGRMYALPFLRLRKLPEGMEFYGKSAWYTLREDCVRDILDYVKEHPDFYEFFRTALCGDEIFFDTLAMHLAGEKGLRDRVLQNNNLLYDDLFDGDRRNVGAPKTITIKDMDAIRASGAFFARKADPVVDRDVIACYEKITGTYAPDQTQEKRAVT